MCKLSNCTFFFLFFLEILSPCVISCLVSTPPPVFMSVDFICILLTSPIHDLKKELSLKFPSIKASLFFVPQDKHTDTLPLI